MKVLIFTNGRYGDPDFYRNYLKTVTEPYIICADGGANFTKKIGLFPNVILGDMDSISQETLKFYEQVEMKRYPVCKDETDTELAISHAIEMNPEEVIILGALGTRIDHSLGNIYLLTRLLEVGIPAKIIDENNNIFLIRDSKMLELPIGTVISLLPLGEACEGINIRGFKYPIVDGRMSLEKPYGMSNVVTLEKQTISVKKGILLADLPRD